MKRVLHVVGGMNQGGTENFIMNVYRNIDRTKIQFDFLVNRKGVFDDEIKSLGGNIYFIPALQKVGPIIYKYKLSKILKKHRNEYNIIHSHINMVSGLILEIAKKCGIPVRIAHSHGSSLAANFIVKKYKEYLGKKIIKNANYYFACSKSAAKFLFNKEYEKAYIIKNGINYEQFHFSKEQRNKIRKKLNISNNSVVIGNVARFNYQKNQKFLLEIFHEYCQKNNNSYLIFVGEGKLQDDLKAKVRMLGIEKNVIFAGTTTHVHEFYSAFDIFILPSFSEGLGIALIEAQASGLICLASKEGVPLEAKVSNKIEYISLNESPNYWATHIKKSYNRENFKIDKSFDIKEQANKLCEFYISENTRYLGGEK